MVKGLGKENDPTPVAPEVAAPAKKDRHVVTWTPQEDDLLREHIALHGIDNWTSIAALFKDKSSRQCRRRWNTYLNSECKKGGWSAEEDMILCEAQKMFGNRWTEIAKVVSGRTDNAVKNRFSTLCKKRSTIEVSSKENRVPCLDPSTKRVLVGEPSVAIVVGEPSTSNKQMRYHISPLKNTCETHKTSLGENGPAQHLQKSPLLAVQSFHTANPSLGDMRGYQYAASNKVIQATFLRKDDPKLTALLPQAELPTSLSEKVNAENNNQSLDEAWKELQAYLIQTEDSGLLRKMFSGMSCRLDELRGLIDDLHNSSKEEQQPLRQVGSHENSQGSSECSTSSMHNVNAGQSRSDHQFMDCSLHKDNEVNHPNVHAACSNMHSYPDEVEDGATTSEFASPLQTIPFSHSFADEIPTPVFTSSERHFLLSLIDLPTPANDNNSTIPSCKRALLDTFKPS